jgi:hypothetical protein
VVPPYSEIVFGKKNLKPQRAMGNLKCILQSERSQSVMATSCMILHLSYSGKCKAVHAVKRCVVARGLGGKKGKKEG